MQNTANVLTVTQATQLIKAHLEPRFRTLTLQGEISNFKLQSSGHMYFSLKDDNAQISSVMFRRQASSLSALPKSGDHVIVIGELSLYPPRGIYQVIVKELFFVGTGAHLLRFEQLKQKLQKMGWFSQERKKTLPKLPRSIGIVTSPTGAAIQDILNVINRRFAGLHIILNPVKVQGDGAFKEIAQAINQFNTFNLVDVIIIGRGGGSIEDLWAFNEEIVAKAIFRSDIPIVSAVGHETDYCISDFVADVRAPTPSAAAELVIAEKAEQELSFSKLQRRLYHTLSQITTRSRQRLASIMQQPALTSPDYIFRRHYQHIDELRNAVDTAIHHNIDTVKLAMKSKRKHLIALNPVTQVVHLRQRFCGYQKNLHMLWMRYLDIRKEKLSRIIATLSALNPQNVLKKGYSITFSKKDNSVIFSAENVTNNQELNIRLFNGEISTTANKVVYYDKK